MTERSAEDFYRRTTPNILKINKEGWYIKWRYTAAGFT